MTITLDGIEFTGPHYLSSCTMPDSAGLYAIMMKHDPIKQPNVYNVIYIGESSNFEERVTQSHHKYECWRKRVNSDDEIHYGLHIMPGSAEEARRLIESRLIEKYQPQCND